MCDLGSLNLRNFITGSKNTNWKKLEQTIKLAVRFLDNVIDINQYTLTEIEIKAKNSRRIGLGVMGLAEYLFAKQLSYGSDKALNEVERLFKFIRDTIYTTSVELSVEKGSFPKFDSVAYGNAHFVRKLKADLRKDIKKYGTRNVTSMAMAPTGTISLLASTTSGIEPLFAKGYVRNDAISERTYIHPIVEEIMINNTDIPDWLTDTTDLKPEDHFETQVIIQKYTDGAVSKTINMPKGTDRQIMSDLLLEYAYDLKGCTVYVDGSREGQILNPLTNEEIKQHIVENKSHDFTMHKEAVLCPTGNCDI